MQTCSEIMYLTSCEPFSCANSACCTSTSTQTGMRWKATQIKGHGCSRSRQPSRMQDSQCDEIFPSLIRPLVSTLATPGFTTREGSLTGFLGMDKSKTGPPRSSYFSSAWTPSFVFPAVFLPLLLLLLVVTLAHQTKPRVYSAWRSCACVEWYMSVCLIFFDTHLGSYFFFFWL